MPKSDPKSVYAKIKFWNYYYPKYIFIYVYFAGLILGGGLFILGTLVENHLVEETSKKALRTIRLEQKDQEIQLTRLQAALESLKHDVRDLKRYEAHVEMASSSLSRSLERNIQYMQARDKEAREKGSANTSLE